MTLKSDIIQTDVYQRLSRAREFMDDCFAQPLDLEAISREACFSSFHFLRLFKEKFNTTPYQYLTRRRIERAKELLVSSGLSVTDICFEVGFESLGSFSSLFRKHVGQAPIKYRARMFIPVSSLAPQVFIPGCFLIMNRSEDPRFS
jgi:AraC-like DNA-binding protein